MPNIKDIAMEAQVGINTVSRYLNQPEALKKSTAQKIRKAMETLGYVPSPRRPGRKTSRRVGLKHYRVILLTLGSVAPATLFSMPGYSLYLDALLSELNLWDISLEFCELPENGVLPAKISARNCDGVILVHERRDREFMDCLYERLADLPTVWSFNKFYDPESRFDKVIYDNAAVGRIAADYFCGRGHRKVLAINASVEHQAYAARVRDFIDHAQRLDMEADTIRSLSEIGHCTPERAEYIAKQLLEESRHQDVTGLFFVSDSVMAAVMLEYRALGGKKDKFELLGCNANLQMLDFFQPIPPSIDIKLAGVGRHTADRLLERINSKNQLPPATQILTPDIVTLTHIY